MLSSPSSAIRHLATLNRVCMISIVLPLASLSPLASCHVASCFPINTFSFFITFLFFCFVLLSTVRCHHGLD
ncbi:hypothetical protein B0F90DRAFT_7980 [Multifurca ochricompacta]|uniref:Uncharacterized protein n=1 Tax=Multifurca ochricompacta TaxID=376703 RepID=A0AAD4MC80_9AGAM|nr:hypothetical protein B0F90DRAFT_7980 [Multifurca ochricompacta]